MPGRDLPLNGAPLAKPGAEGYVSYSPPENDAADISAAQPSHGSKPGAIGATHTGPAVPSPLVPVSLPTMVQDAPNNPQTWNSGDKGENWMGTPAYPTSATGTVPYDTNKRKRIVGS